MSVHIVTRWTGDDFTVDSVWGTEQEARVRATELDAKRLGIQTTDVVVVEEWVFGKTRPECDWSPGREERAAAAAKEPPFDLRKFFATLPKEERRGVGLEVTYGPTPIRLRCGGPVWGRLDIIAVEPTLLTEKYPKLADAITAAVGRMLVEGPQWADDPPPWGRPPPSGTLCWSLVRARIEQVARDLYPEAKIEWSGP